MNNNVNCNFKTNFKNTNAKKINIISVSFFYTQSMYKDPNQYFEPLKVIVGMFLEIKHEINIPNYKFRIYYDQSIFEKENKTEVRKFFNEISDYDDIQLVEYDCPKFKDKKDSNFHISLFGSVIRFFPFFDYDENKNIETCIVSDIDFKGIRPTRFLIQMKKHEFFFNIYVDLYFNKNHDEIKKTDRCPNFEYCPSAGCVFFRQKFSKKYLDDFFDDSLKEEKPKYVEVLKNLVNTSDKIKLSFDDFWLYGIDEIFLGIFINDIIENKKISFAYTIISGQINWLFKNEIKYIIKILDGVEDKVWNMLLQDIPNSDKMTTDEKLQSLLVLFSYSWDGPNNRFEQAKVYHMLKKRMINYVTQYNKFPIGVDENTIQYFKDTFLTANNSSFIVFNGKKIILNIYQSKKNRITEDVVKFATFASNKYKVPKSKILKSFRGEYK